MKISKCRLCGSKEIVPIINLGYQKYTGVFPKSNADLDGGGELEIVKCCAADGCGLVQLSQSFDPGEMYGDNYGYHSSLNSSMVDHLRVISDEISDKVGFADGDVILDIGSNDGTLLSMYRQKGLDNVTLVGIDPSAGKFRKYYDNTVVLVEDFFSEHAFYSAVGDDRKAKVVTSIAMFYDLEDPIAFAKDVERILDNDGIWVMEQSYLPLMIQTNSYDTICHEHIEFYSFKQIEYIADHVGLRIVDVSTNDTNGGSFRITMCKSASSMKPSDSVRSMHDEEMTAGVDSLRYFESFRERIETHREEVLDFLNECRENGKLVLGYGASTKGNVVLQYCGITQDLLKAIVEVNPDKYGCVTPGSDIPIISEEEGKSMKPDYYLVLPWHFRNNILDKEEEYRRQSGVKFVFALPEFEIV